MPTLDPVHELETLLSDVDVEDVVLDMLLLF